MALAVTLRASGELGLNTGGAAVSQAIAAVDFAAGSLVMVVLGATTDDPAPGAPYLTCSASGLTFTREVDGFVASTFRAVAAVLTAPHTSGGSTTLTLSTSAQATFGIFYSVYEVTGHDTTTPIGATAGNADETQDGQRTLTLDAAPADTSIVIAGITADTNSGTNQVTPGTGWTEDVEVDSSGSNFGFWQTQRRTGSTSTNVVWDDVRPPGSTVVFSTGAVAVEVVEGAAGPDVTLGTHSIQTTHQPLSVTAAGSATTTLGTHGLTVAHQPLTVNAAGQASVNLASHAVEITHHALTVTGAGTATTTLASHVVELAHQPLTVNSPGATVQLASHAIETTHHALTLAAAGSATASLTSHAVQVQHQPLAVAAAGAATVDLASHAILATHHALAVFDPALTADPNPLHFTWRDRSTHGAHTEASHGVYRESAHAVYRERS